MNGGLIVGRVRDKRGNAVGGATVWIFDIFGKAGGYILAFGDQNVRVGSPMTETDSDGYFELAFAWSGTNIGAVIGGAGRVRMFIAAHDTVWNGEQSNITYAASPVPIAGYLLKDVLGLAGLTPPDLKSFPGLLEFSKDIVESVTKLKSHPVFKVHMLTSESWLILGAAALVVNK